MKRRSSRIKIRIRRSFAFASMSFVPSRLHSTSAGTAARIFCNGPSNLRGGGGAAGGASAQQLQYVLNRFRNRIQTRIGNGGRGLRTHSLDWDSSEGLGGENYADDVDYAVSAADKSSTLPGQQRRGNSLTSEHREKISQALKGKKKPPGFMNDVHKAKIKATQSNKKKPKNFMNEEHRQKISESMREAWKRRKAKKKLEEEAKAMDEMKWEGEEGRNTEEQEQEEE